MKCLFSSEMDILWSSSPALVCFISKASDRSCTKSYFWPRASVFSFVLQNIFRLLSVFTTAEAETKGHFLQNSDARDKSESWKPVSARLLVSGLCTAPLKQQQQQQTSHYNVLIYQLPEESTKLILLNLFFIDWTPKLPLLPKAQFWLF